MKKRVLLGIAAAAVLTAGSAMAAAPVITDVTGGGTTAPHNPYQIKYIAYEMYNNITGVNSNNVEFFARLSGDVSKGDSVNIKGYNADVNLGSGNLFLLGMVDNIAVNNAAAGVWTTAANNHPITAAGSTALAGRASGAVISHTIANGLCSVAVGGFATGAGPTIYAVIGDSNATGVQNQVTMLGADLGTFCRLNTGDATLGTTATTAGLVSTDKVMALTPTGGNTWVSTAQGTLSNDAANTDVGRVIPSVQFGLNLYVNANLNPSCTVPKDIQLHLVTNQETINPTTVLQIIPQFVATQSATALQQELSTNDDFKSFIDSNNATYTVFNRSLGNGGTLYNLVDRHFTPAQAYAGMFRSFVPQTANASLDFSLSSLTAQPTVTMAYYNLVPAAVACTKSADNKVFTCSTGTLTSAQITTAGVPAANGVAGTSNALSVANGASEMVPTSWSTTNFVFKINNVTDSCVTASGNVGNWYGGIEAIVPFVKRNAATGYETYIKLFNRYQKAAKVYVANMNQITDSIVTSITQIAGKEEIATGGVTEYSGEVFQNAGFLTADELNTGAPVKFLIRVPSQAGSPAFTTLADNVVPVLNGGSAAGVATASVVDPYITGVVVQVVPGGSQRSISLMFKSFKQGQYGSN